MKGFKLFDSKSEFFKIATISSGVTRNFKGGGEAISCRSHQKSLAYGTMYPWQLVALPTYPILVGLRPAVPVFAS